MRHHVTGALEYLLPILCIIRSASFPSRDIEREGDERRIVLAAFEVSVVFRNWCGGDGRRRKEQKW